MSGNISVIFEEEEVNHDEIYREKKSSLQSTNGAPVFTHENSSGPFKVLLLGDASVGKTSLITRLITGKFRDQKDGSYVATIGIDYKRKVKKKIIRNTFHTTHFRLCILKIRTDL